MTHRRDFLKAFGLGTSIVPIMGGAPLFAAESKLIEVPKVEPVDNLSALASGGSAVFRTTIIVENRDGTRIAFAANNAVLEPVYSYSEFGSRWNQVPDYVVGSIRKIKVRLEGELFPDEHETLMHVLAYP